MNTFRGLLPDGTLPQAAQDQVRDLTGITVDTTVGTRVFVGDTMIYGDTGWRDLEIAGTSFISGKVLMKRVLDEVIIKFVEVEIPGLEEVTVSSFISDSGYIPTSFRPDSTTSRPNGLLIGVYTNYTARVAVTQASRLVYLATGTTPIGMGAARGNGEIRYTTNRSWPTSLPGMPG